MEGYNKVYRHEYMDIHWRVTTRFTEVHGYTLEGYNNTDMNTWIYIGGLQLWKTIPGGLLTTKPGRKKRELEQDAAFSLVPISCAF